MKKLFSNDICDFSTRDVDKYVNELYEVPTCEIKDERVLSYKEMIDYIETLTSKKVKEDKKLAHQLNLKT